ncbi:MAG TPA: adenylate/guanylate cyclase domain-containing protein [Chloroflexota bacterium]
MSCPGCGSAVGLDVAFCAVCGTPAGPQCPRCARQCRTGDRFCALCGAEVAGEGADSLHLRRAERKLVTVVFSDMVGFTSLGHHFDAETVREAMTSFFRALAAVVRSQGGYVEKFIGDAMLSVFGAPVSRQDDAERALEAAIEMQRALEEVNALWAERLGRTIQIRIGVNSGIAVAGPIGEGRATDYGVCGDVVNTGARFQAAADPGQTIIGQATRELAGRSFLYAAIPPLTLKGKPEPVPAYRLLGRAEAVAELFASAPLVGRQAELCAARAAATGAIAGPVALHVGGESGAGKTRFLAALRRDEELAGLEWILPSTADGAPLAVARGIARALAGEEPAARLASRLLGRDDELATGLVEWLTGGDGSPDSPAGALAGRRRSELLADLFLRLLRAAPDPVAIGLDDAEGLDGASARLLARAVSHGDGARFLLVTTSGGNWRPPWPLATETTLSELSGDDLRSLLAAALGDEEIAPEAREVLASAAGGNPLALTELVWSYRESGRLPEPRAGGVAATILGLVQARIDAVDEDAKRVLQVGAVVGATFPAAVVARVLGERFDVDGALARLRRRNLVAGGEDVRFAQAAIRTVAYEGLLLAERRRLHAEVAHAFEAGGETDPYLLAHHHGAGDDDAAAVAALAGAAEAHLAAGDPAAALDGFRGAIERLGGAEGLGGQRRALLLGRVADVQALRGEVAAARATFDEAILALENGLARAELLRRRALVEHRGGDDGAALDSLQEARDDVTLAEVDGRESVEAIFAALASLAGAAARVHLGGRRGDEASSEARQSLEMLSHLGADFALRPAARRPAAEANEIIAATLIEQGAPASASEHADAARVAFAELRDLGGCLRADVLIARARVLEGSTLEARARLEAARDLALRLGDRDGLALVDRALAEMAVTA